jgi:N-acetylglucosamine malate deacetylase 1
MNILAVGSHYDDVELGCGGTLIKHVQNGDSVTILAVTDSSYRNPDGEIVRSAEEALMEGKLASELIGAKLISLNYEVFRVPFDDILGKVILNYIEKLEIDTIYSHWVNDLHRDHQHAGKTTLMAGRHAPRFLMFRSNFYDTERQFRGNFYSDISDVMDKKIEVIKTHKSELERVRYKWLEFFIKQHANDGQTIGVNYAECFEVVRYLI